MDSLNINFLFEEAQLYFCVLNLLVHIYYHTKLILIFDKTKIHSFNYHLLQLKLNFNSITGQLNGF